MADSTPLLSQRDSLGSALSESRELEKNQYPSLDETIERCIGEFGWSQFLQAVLISFAWAFDAQQTFISVFTDARPTWHCTPLGKDWCSGSNSNSNDVCQLPKTAWAWDLPPVTSIVSEWSLQCAGSVITGLPASSFFLGCLAGGLLLATLADSSLGRKNMLLLSCLVMSVAGLLTVVSNNIWIYSGLRFLCGIGRAQIGTCALVLSTELVGKRWRGQVGIIGFFCFTLGFLSLPAVAYLNRGCSWRILYMWTCIPAIFYCVICHLFVRESPRWLFVRGRKEEFMATLKSIAPAATTLRFSGSWMSFEQDKEEERKVENDRYAAMKMLMSKSWAFRRVMAVMVVGFGIGMVYYGMPLGAGGLDLSIYLSMTLNALSELPASLVTFFLIGRLNRKGATLGLSILSGICSVLCAMLSVMMSARANMNTSEDKGDGGHYNNYYFWNTSNRASRTATGVVVQMGLELLSFFSACTAFNVLLIYTLELFPTCVRNSAISMVRQALVLGGAFSPVLAAAGAGAGGRKQGGLGLLWSYGVFGLTIGLCGLFVGCLPETRGGTLCDTMDELERKLEEEETKKRSMVEAAATVPLAV